MRPPATTYVRRVKIGCVWHVQVRPSIHMPWMSSTSHVTRFWADKRVEWWLRLGAVYQHD